MAQILSDEMEAYTWQLEKLKAYVNGKFAGKEPFELVKTSSAATAITLAGLYVAFNWKGV